VDIWALGVVLYVLAFSKFPFDPCAPLAILSGKYTLPAHVEAKKHTSTVSTVPTVSIVTGLIALCLTVNPLQRATIDQVLERLGADEGAVGAGGERGRGRGGGGMAVQDESDDWARFDDE
jgi:serine/threonine protein kinase